MPFAICITISCPAIASSPRFCTILGKFGRAGRMLGELASTHAIDCRNENEIYVGEILSWRVQKITLHP